MYKSGQLVRSKISETVYLILADFGFYYEVRVLASPRRLSAAGMCIRLTKDFDGEIVANNYRIK